MYVAPLCNFIFPRELWFLMIFIVSHSLCSKFFINELIVVYWSNVPARPRSKEKQYN